MYILGIPKIVKSNAYRPVTITMPPAVINQIWLSAAGENCGSAGARHHLQSLP